MSLLTSYNNEEYVQQSQILVGALNKLNPPIGGMNGRLVIPQEKQRHNQSTQTHRLQMLL